MDNLLMAAVLLSMFILGLIFGSIKSVEDVRSRAVKAEVAHYDVIDATGKTKFVWNECKGEQK